MTHDQAREGTPLWEQPEVIEKAAKESHRAIEEHYEDPKYAVPWEALAEFEREASRKAARAVLAAVGPDIATAVRKHVAQAIEDIPSHSAIGQPHDPWYVREHAARIAREDADR